MDYFENDIGEFDWNININYAYRILNIRRQI